MIEIIARVVPISIGGVWDVLDLLGDHQRMSIELTADHVSRVFRASCKQYVTFEDFNDFFRALESDPRLSAYDKVLDVGEGLLVLTLEELEAIDDHVRQLSSSGRPLIVAERD